LRPSASRGWHRDHPESGCGVTGVAADVARAGDSAQASYTRRVQECLAVLADLIDNPGGQAGEREAAFIRSVLRPPGGFPDRAGSWLTVRYATHVRHK
jgi:hypothetical protein